MERLPHIIKQMWSKRNGLPQWTTGLGTAI